MNAITKPMLASKCERPDQLPFPVLATPKLDGIRCLKVGGRALTRSFKPISNRFAREWIEANLPDGVDGELMLRDGTFSETTSAIGRRDGQPDFVLHVFDYVCDGNLHEPYCRRVADLEGLLGFSESDPRSRHLVFVTPTVVRNSAELVAYEEGCIAAGYEGVMVRTPDSPYKCGRSTEHEAWLLKIKRFEDAEAVVLEPYEGMTNQNAAELDAFGRTKRSLAQAGMIGRGELGGFIVRHLSTGVEFRLGYNHVVGGIDRVTLWQDRQSLIGRVVKFSHQPSGAKEAPRFPKFIGFRESWDMGSAAPFKPFPSASWVPEIHLESWCEPTSRGLGHLARRRDQSAGDADVTPRLEVEDQLVDVQAGLAAGVEGCARTEAFGCKFVQPAKADPEGVPRDDFKDFLTADQGGTFHGCGVSEGLSWGNGAREFDCLRNPEREFKRRMLFVIEVHRVPRGLGHGGLTRPFNPHANGIQQPQMAGEKWCVAACGWRATNDAGGWQEEGCRNAGTPALTGIQIPPDPKMKPQDPQAEAITFGVELETTIPATSGVVIGGYHNGSFVRAGVATSTGLPLHAPGFNGNYWKAERDASIRANPGRMACEFVSPILQGGDGVAHLLQFLEWARAIGANVNGSCGCHITVGVKSIIGTDDPQAMSEYARKLAHIARWHAMSLYGQTGTGRHLNRYSHTLGDDVGTLVRQMERRTDPSLKTVAARQCGRGMINFQKLFSHGVIEFRVFAGTLNRHKLLHHLATVLGLCRRAAEVECLGSFAKNKSQAKRTATAKDALRFLWDYLGWTGGKRPVALGLVGPLHSGFKTYRKVAERMCRRFDSRFPFANL